jgi:hypothetical protein
MCFFFSLLLLGPRFVLVIWWLADQVRWAATFDTIVLPILGFLFLPWTTLMYVLVFPFGLDTADWIWLIFALVVDLVSLGGGGLQGRDRYMGQPAPPP